MKIKNLLSFRLKYYILLQIQRFKSIKPFSNQIIDKNRNQIYIFLAADYGNLGDVAITYAQTKFLNENSGFQVIEIPISQSLEGLWFVRRHIKKGDIVTTVGGGNLGDLYDQIEYIRQLVVRFFPENRIVSFPQTFDFSETKEGIKALKIAQNVYNRHRDFHMVAREETSFKLMKQYFPKANPILTPDIVLTLNQSISSKERKGAVICMRKDNEKFLSPEQNQFVIDQIHERFNEVEYYDTHINKDKLSTEDRDLELKTIWEKFKGAELVITDRLHGMIFCYITNTPCLVFQNNNHKVRETYHWIKANPSVHLVTEFSDLSIMEFFQREDFNSANMLDLKNDYQLLIKLLN